MDPDQRRVSGSYYTPAGLVRDVLRAGLEATLVHRFGLAPAAAERWIYRSEPPDRRPDLRHLAVLDPAVGSGAFLLGALEELTRLRCAGGEAPAPVVRRDVLARSLFGIDLKLTAVRLAELRLWLALVADEDEPDLARITPLPNLDGHVRQGDALIDPLTLARTLSRSPALTGGAMLVDRLGAARRRHSRAGCSPSRSTHWTSASPSSSPRPRIATCSAAGAVSPRMGACGCGAWRAMAAHRSSRASRTSATSWRAADSISSRGIRRGSAASGCPRRSAKHSRPATPRGARGANEASRTCRTWPSPSWSGRSSSRPREERWRCSCRRSSPRAATPSRCAGGSPTQPAWIGWRRWTRWGAEREARSEPRYTRWRWSPRAPSPPAGSKSPLRWGRRAGRPSCRSVRSRPTVPGSSVPTRCGSRGTCGAPFPPWASVGDRGEGRSSA